MDLEILCPSNFQTQIKNTFQILMKKFHPHYFDICFALSYIFCAFGCSVLILSLWLLPVFCLKHRLIISNICFLVSLLHFGVTSVFCLSLV